MDEMVENVRMWALTNGKPPVPPRFVMEALMRIAYGLEEPLTYADGQATLESIYLIASKLEARNSTQN